MDNENVIELRRCKKCGKRAQRMELAFGDDKIAEFDGCSDCVQEVADTIARYRPVFDSMIAVGVSREIANATMTHLLGLIDGDALV